MKKLLLLLTVFTITVTSAQQWVDIDQSINNFGSNINVLKVVVTENNEKFILYSESLGEDSPELYLKKYNESSKIWEDAVANPFVTDVYNAQLLSHNGNIVIGYFDYSGANPDDYKIFGHSGSNLTEIGSFNVPDNYRIAELKSNNIDLYLLTIHNDIDRVLEIKKYNSSASWSTELSTTISNVQSYNEGAMHITDTDIWLLANSGTAVSGDSLYLYQSTLGSGTLNVHEGLAVYATDVQIAGDDTGFPFVGFIHSSNLAVKSVDAGGTNLITEDPVNQMNSISMGINNGLPTLLFIEDNFPNNILKILEWNGSSWLNHSYGDIATANGFDSNIESPTMFNYNNTRQIIIYNNYDGGMQGKSGQYGLQLRMTNEVPISASYTTNDHCASAFNAILSGDFKVTDADMDSTYLFFSSNTDDPSILDTTNITIESPAYNALSTSRTFVIKADYFGSDGNVNVPIGITDGYDTIVVTMSIDVNPAPIVTNLLPGGGDLEVCSNGDLFDLNGAASPAGGVWGGPGVEDHYFDPTADMGPEQSPITYTFTDANGCDGVLYINPVLFDIDPIAVSSTNSSCTGADGTATASMTTGANAPYDYYWSTGSTNTSVTNLAPGVYYVNVTDINECVAVKQVNIQSTNIVLNEEITNVTCFGGNDGAIDFSPLGFAPFQMLWSTGDSTEDISNLSAGHYSVTVTDNAGCISTANYEVTQPSALSFTTSISASSCITDNGSAATYDHFGGSGNYTHWWSTGQSSNELFTAAPGTYEYVLSDDNGCLSDTATINVGTVNGPNLFASSNNATCNGSDGNIDLTIQENNAPISSILWSNSSTNEDLTGLSAGTYTVTVTDDDNCKSYLTKIISVIRPLQNDICVVTVDSVTTTNLVVWEKEQTSGIDHYNIYREGPVAGSYLKIGEKNASNLSQFVDLAASPEVRSWRYRISATNDCNVEGPKSAHHKTIHIVFAEDAGNYDITWDQYEGFNYPTFFLERRDAVNTNWVPVTNGPSATFFSYTDTPPTADGLDYRVSVDAPNGCQATKANDYNSSRSNRSAGTFAPEDVDLAILSNGILTYNISVYPNPASNELNIVIDGSELSNITIRTINGQIVNNEKINGLSYHSNISHLAAGIYFVEVATENGKTIHKLIKK